MLRNNFSQEEISHIYIDEGEKQDLMKPCFLVDVLPMPTRMENKYLRNKLIKVGIKYFSSDGGKGKDVNIIDRLNQVFDTVFSVDDRILTIREKATSLENEILDYSFQVSFIEGVEMVEIIRDGKVILIPEVDLDEGLGYTVGDIELMKKIQIKEEF